MPVVGLGTWKAAPGVVCSVVYEAIKVGWRHLDCACDYGNEQEVGAGIKRALDEGICSRQDLFITTKLWNTYHAREHVKPALQKSLADLQLDYVDLFLIHFPISLAFVPFEERYPPEWTFHKGAPMPDGQVFANVPISETWGAMEEVHALGLAKAIGVSNFSCALVMDLLKTCKVPPAVNQVEMHPYLTQTTFLSFMRRCNIAVTAFSPLGIGSYVPLGQSGDSVLNEPTVTKIASRLSRSPAQVVLRWAVQRGVSLVPKTSSVPRLQENISIFDFQLTAEDCAAIDALNRNHRYNNPGHFANFPIYD